jgi:predicted transcriptional regulator
METILLSIKSEYAERILKGEKLYEYRRKIARKPVSKIIIYVTSPVMQIIGEVGVKTNTISGSPSVVWEQTKKNAGISRDKFRRYFKGYHKAYAYSLENAVRYEVPKTLNDYGVSHPPQSFIYLGEQS